MRRQLVLLALVILSSACISTGPQSAAKFVKMPQDAPKGKITSTVAGGFNIPSEGGGDAQLGGFGGEGYMARYSESYDWSVGVTGGALFYDANFNLATGKTRFGLLHGLGLNFSYQSRGGGIDGSDSLTNASVSPTLGIFFQHSLSSLNHLYGSARLTYSKLLTSEEDSIANDIDSTQLTGTFGYAIMEGTEGLSVYPELILGYNLDSETLSIGFGFSMAANFL
jgi:hypothetical protein